MKKLLFGLLVTAIFGAIFPSMASASVNKMVIRDFQSDYYLSKDIDGRSTMKVTEKITAEFALNQSHRLIRTLPLYYNEHLTALEITSVTDENGAVLQYEALEENGYLAVKVGDLDVYVNGVKQYIISYQQRDITKYFSNTDDDEFFWNINGSHWDKKIDKLVARIHVDSSILSGLTGKSACYYGPAGSNSRCNLIEENDVYSSAVYDLAPGENMTISIGFLPHYFTPFKMTAGGIIQKYISVISLVFGGALFVAIIIIRVLKGKGASGSHAIVAEYLPPKDSDVAVSSIIYNKPAPWTAALYIDLAVRHNIKIIEDSTVKGKYNLELVSLDGLSSTEINVIYTLFSNSPQVGARYVMDPENPDQDVAPLLSDIYKSLKLETVASGYYTKSGATKLVLAGLCILMFLQAIVALGLTVNGYTLYGSLPTIFFFLAFSSIPIITSLKPLSQKGRELSDYLAGLKLYISVAEEERIKILQSPQGAEKTPIDTNDKLMLVHLYERVLPYAVLFGQEKEWIEALGRFYTLNNATPEWYSGSDGMMFDASSFSSTFSDFSSDVSSSGSGFDSGSSDFGGSDGGGDSGDGGGDGGGGDD